jgi:quercetin dioxygenase-like cupin family protein
MLLREKHLNDLRGKCARGFPEVITHLPEADVQFKGVRAWIVQGEKHQLIFFEMEPYAQVPEHSHDYPQWGIMVEGKMELTIDGKTRICEKGDEYVIPAKAKHYARFPSKARVIDFFSEKTRYRTKSAK